jgi:hypothetical protein
VRYFDAARGAACAALEPAQTSEVGVHPPLLSIRAVDLFGGKS